MKLKYRELNNLIYLVLGNNERGEKYLFSDPQADSCLPLREEQIHYCSLRWLLTHHTLARGYTESQWQ